MSKIATIAFAACTLPLVALSPDPVGGEGREPAVALNQDEAGAADKPSPPKEPWKHMDTPLRKLYAALPQADRFPLGPIDACGRVEEKALVITWIDPDGPGAKSGLAAGDKIVEANSKALGAEPLMDYGNALNTAEGRGKLVLELRRNGDKVNIEVELPKLGAHAEKMSIREKKTDAILRRACDKLVEWQNADGRIGEAYSSAHGNATLTAIAGLAWLAYDAERYKDNIARAAKCMAGLEEKVDDSILPAWGFAQAAWFLAEYVLLTKDTSVLEGLRRCTSVLASFQRTNGGWGHGARQISGARYDALAIATVQALVALEAAAYAGVPIDPDVERKGLAYLASCLDIKGGIGYEPVEPGKFYKECYLPRSYGTIAAFALAGEKSELIPQITEFCEKNKVDVTQGHASPTWGLMMCAVGAQMLDATGGRSNYKDMVGDLKWYFTIARRSDGMFMPVPSREAIEKSDTFSVLFDAKWWPIGSTVMHTLTLALGKGTLLASGKGVKKGKKPPKKPAKEPAKDEVK